MQYGIDCTVQSQITDPWTGELILSMGSNVVFVDPNGIGAFSPGLSRSDYPGFAYADRLRQP